MATIKPKQDTVAAFTITLASLANAAGRISTQLDLTTARPRLLKIFWKITAGAVAPTAGSPYILYLVRSDAKATGEHVDGGYGLVDAAVATQPNSLSIIDVIPVIATAAQGHASSAEIWYPSAKMSVLVWNASGQAISTTEADHYIRYTVEYDESV